jgi:glycosyltransferase involved in cell wall biosynthesis
MKLLNLSFYPIKKEELDFVKYRHRHDKEIFSTFAEDWHIQHLKVVRDGNSAKYNTSTEKYFPGTAGFFFVPWEMLKYAKQQKPDMVFVHSFLFPVQFLALRLMLSKSTKFIVQHHAEFPFKNFLKSFIQRRAYSPSSLFLFAAPELAVPFIKSGVVDPEKVMQLMEVSSMFEPVTNVDLPMHNDHGQKPMFVWVGRLDSNKDPHTVLNAFISLREKGKDFRLYMLYGGAALEEEIKAKIEKHKLTHHVILLGKRSHEEVRHWMSQADYFISASHYEGSGVALSESMACGCVPVVTDIPSFRAMTRDGSCAYFFKAGDALSLCAVLEKIPDHPDPEKMEMARRIFNEDLSPHAISRHLYAALSSLSRRN